MKISDLKKFKLPDLSGVYLFKKGGDLLYVGKATSLKDRVKSYFSKDLINTRGPLILDMVFKADKVDFIETQNALEALVLEAALIKKNQPYYNTKEKDNKSFNYVCITDQEIPLVVIERGKNIDFKNLSTKDYKIKTLFGPFPNGNQLRDALKILRRIFPFIDKSSIQKDKSVFYRQIGLSPDIEDENAIKKYKKNIKNLEMFLSGSFGDVRKNLEKEMFDFAESLKFEEANTIKKKLFALDHIEDVALIKRENINKTNERIEGYDIAHISGKNIVGVMTVVTGGEPEKNEYRKFKIQTVKSSNDTESLKEVLRRRLKHPEWQYPKVIVADGGVAQKRALESVIKENNLEIPVVSVVKDNRHKPRAILGSKKIVDKYKLSILLVNQESHRFAVNFHRKLRSKLV
jgi:excinuclease ABC subunit C